MITNFYKFSIGEKEKEAVQAGPTANDWSRWTGSKNKEITRRFNNNKKSNKIL